MRTAIAIACAGLALGAQATTVTSSRIGDTRVVLPPGVYKPGEAGVELLQDYGSFQLYRLDAAHAVELGLVDRATAPLSNIIQFNAEPLNAARNTTVIPASLRAQKSAGSALQVVQFVGPIADQWLKALSAAGVRVLQYIPDNAYIVRADNTALNALADMARDGTSVQYTTEYAPYYKLDANLAARARAGLQASKELDVTVQVVGGFDNSQSKKSVQGLGKPLGDWFDVGVGQAIRLHVAESALTDLAQIGDVFAVEEYIAPRKMDERQDQIIAGNLNPTQSGPSGIGYVNWLANMGFPTTASSYPVVDVADDGVGTGVASTAAGDVVLRVGGVAANPSRLLLVNNCTADAAGDGVAGHGHINTTIVGGNDPRVGFPYIDPLGYQRGLGVNPFVNLTHTKIFNNAGSFVITNCGGNDAGLAKKELAGGAYISSNSWGAPVSGAYNTDSQAYDRATRDADTTVANNQPMVFVFAAGNDGPGASTVGSPGTGKNVITVGASENQRPTDEDGNWTDGCGEGPSGADNAMDVVDFSSRGPTGSAAYARKKPEIIAPGTHIQGSASTAAGYDGTGVCDKYRPSGQTVFAASSGTSHSTPAMSGAASLVAYYVKSHFQAANPNYATAGVWPSAAAIKAYMMAHTTYLTGVSANDNLPSNNQGYGMPNLGRAFDNETLRFVNDQQNVLAATGDTYTWTGVVADPTKPLKISMAFSDAAGATTGSPVVNNLDLSVVVNGNTYLGNVFTGQNSTTGGAADPYNNYEAVFLPAGVSGNITITVKGTNIAGDGVPNNGDTTDQDFALVCSNCSNTADFTVAASPASVAVCAGTPATFSAQVNALNGFSSAVALSVVNLPSGASATFTPPSVTPPTTTTSAGSIATSGVASGTYNLQLRGTAGSNVHNGPLQLTVSTPLPGAATLATPANNAYGVSSTPTLTWSAVAGALNYVVEVDDDPGFGSINYTATVSSGSTSHTVATSLNGNTHYYWRVKAHNSCGDTVSAVFSFVTLSTPVCTTIASTNVPLTISASGTPTITSTLTSAAAGTISDVNVVGLKGTHSWINDLDFKLTNPSNVVVQIMAQSCGNQDNFDLNLDDAAAGTAGGWPCPPTGGGTYKPSNPLAGLNGSTATGTWTLTVHDNANSDGGSLTGWGLQICASTAPTLVDAVNDTYAVTLNTALTVAAPGVLANDVPTTGLTTTVVTNPAHGTLALNSNGSFVYTPATDYCGSDSFTYQATNGTASDNATVNFTMSCGGNTAPVASNDSYAGFEDTAIVVAAPGVLSNDTDADGNPLSAILVTGPAHGSLTLNSNGSFSYTPAANYCGGDTFTYKANDGTADSNPATVAISLTCINDAPVAANDSYTTNEDTPLVIAAPGVLANDTDADTNPLTAVLVTGPAHGTLTLNPNGSFTFTPASNYNGTDSFTYKANDGTADSNVATVALTISAVNDAPVAVADSIAVNQGGTATTLVGGATSVLANDTDVENNTLTAVLGAGPTHGALTLNPNGTFSYTQDDSTGATDSFTYHACDNGTPSQCGSNVTVSITVNRKPVAGCTVPPQVLKEGDTVSIALAGLFTDPESQTLSYSATGLPNGLTLSGTGQLSGTLAAGASTGSPYASTITATDTGGASFSRSFSIAVLTTTDPLFRSGFDDPANAAACH